MPRWLVLLALAAPLAAADPRRDADGVTLPARALARLGSTRFRTWEKLTGPVFTPAGELLFSEPDGEAVHFRFMDARTGLFVRKVTLRSGELAGHDAVQNVLGVSDDGRAYVVLTAEAGTRRSHVVTWDIARGKVIARTPMDVRSGVAPFSDNLRWYAQFDRDTGDVTVADARTGLSRQVCRVEPDARPELFPAPDGQSVVVGTDAALAVYDVGTGKLIREVVTAKIGHALSGMSARFSGDGKTVVVRVSGKEQIRGVWQCDTRTGQVERLDIKAEDHLVSSVSPDGGRLIATGRDFRGELLLDLRTGRRVEVVGSFRNIVRFDAAGDRFVTKGPRQITVHDAASGEPLTPNADPLPVALQFHDGGRTVAAFGDTTVTLWDAAAGRERTRFDRPKEWRGLPFAGGRKVFAESPDGLFALIDPLTGRVEPRNWKYLANARAVQPTRCGRFVVAAFSNDGQTRVLKFAVSSGEVVGEVHGLPIRDAANLSISADGNRAVVTGERGLPPGGLVPPLGLPGATQVIACDLATGKSVYHRRHRVDLRLPPLKFSSDGSRLLLLSTEKPDGRNVLDVEPQPCAPGGVIDPITGHLIASVPNAEVFVVTAVSADGRAFAVGDFDGGIRVLEAATGGVRTTFQHKDAITALAFSPDGTALAAASPDAPVYLWDVRGKLLGLPKTFDAATGDALWVALASSDAAKAFDAMQRLAAAPGDAVTLLARMQPPAVAPAPEWFAERVNELRSRSFAVRERATAELEAVAEVVQPWLTAERKRSESPEVQRRLARALAAIGSNSPDRLRMLRSVEVLEWLRTPAAADVLTAYAGGAARAPLTAAAGQAVRQR